MLKGDSNHRTLGCIQSAHVSWECISDADMGSDFSSQCQVELNRKVLADLAIYEPKTFKSLAALAQRRRQEGFAAALGDGKEPEGVFSRVVRYH